jgi:hypothetical protein
MRCAAGRVRRAGLVSACVGALSIDRYRLYRGKALLSQENKIVIFPL